MTTLSLSLSVVEFQRLSTNVLRVPSSVSDAVETWNDTRVRLKQVWSPVPDVREKRSPTPMSYCT